MDRASTTIIALSAFVIGAVGFGVYESRQSKDAEKRIAILEDELAKTKTKTKHSAKENMSVDFGKTFVTWTKPTQNLAPQSGSVGDDIHARVAALKDILVRLPEQSIPELKLATDSDWYNAVDGKLESEEDYRRALGKLRSLAERRFARMLQPALRDYLRANDGKFPNDTSQLQQFVGSEIDGAMLQRYKVVPASEISNVKMGGTSAITQVSLVDSEYDSTSVIGPNGSGSTNVQPGLLQEQSLLMPAIRAYQAAHGERHTDILQVMPYATTPEQQAIIQKWSQSSKGRPR